MVKKMELKSYKCKKSRLNPVVSKMETTLKKRTKKEKEDKNK